MKILQSLKYAVALAWTALKTQVGAFSITNFRFAVLDSSFVPSMHREFADQTMVAGTVVTATVDTGIVGNKWVRVRAIVKTLTGLAATGRVQITVQAGTGAAITNPTNIAQQTVGMITGDTALLFQFEGWSNAGFQSYAVAITALSAAGAVDAGVTAVADVMVDIA
jgi:hypothetical protein